jgi:hypothetical protein
MRWRRARWCLGECDATEQGLRNPSPTDSTGRERGMRVRCVGMWCGRRGARVSQSGRVWKHGCGQPGLASKPWPDLGRLKRATHSCLGYWPNPSWSRRAGVWAPSGSQAGSPTAINHWSGMVFGVRPGRPTTRFHPNITHTRSETTIWHTISYMISSSHL